ncbi:MAG: hypothetical protein JST70_04555 [Bacteroidetes bacterium]|nr:hypothetical protein [Bacteroidota bacterium]
MKYTFSLLMLVLVVAASCRKKEDTHVTPRPPVQPKKENSTYGYFLPNSHIDSSYDAYWQKLRYMENSDSTHMAFRYGHYDTTGHAVELMFQVDSGLTSFSYSGKELKEHRVVYSGSTGDNKSLHYALVEQGTVWGRLIKGDNWLRDEWIIGFDVKLNQLDTMLGLTGIADTITARLNIMY